MGQDQQEDVRRDTFDALAAARRVLRTASTGGLGTVGEDGHPFTSLVTAATTISGEPVMLLSDLAVHTRNLKRDARASILLVEPGGEAGDPLAGARLTVVGRVVADADPRLRSRFLARHPEASGYADFKDFSFYRMAVEAAHLVAGFGRIVTIAGTDLLVDAPPSLADGEAGAVAHMNEDHADAVQLYATRLLGLPDGPWKLTGLDPHGLDMSCAGRSARLDFDAPIDGPGKLRQTLVALAGQARGMAA
ncbi:HugZ family protein [Microbaculum marinum]|uniref:DUF2470 domain-containing protein n=1 Tax=Microbaculum marinum TaxID=1764581 RepID=A0AAW9S006_9HYPH